MLEIPITIRGHHLIPYSDLVRKDSPLSPQDVATNVFLSALILAEIEEKFGSATDTYCRRYMTDLLGKSQQSALDVKSGLQKSFQNFLDSPGRRKVYITEAQKDSMCLNAAIGEHCTMLVANKLDNIYGDGLYLNNFLESADRLNIPLKINTIEKIFPDDPTKMRRKIRIVVTDVENTTKVLQDSQYLSKQEEIKKRIDDEVLKLSA
ncbi:MAG TPA: hypothetical protein VF189_05585 [Patescibacteria group bacterium]